jgi:hypothetical protein
MLCAEKTIAILRHVLVFLLFSPCGGVMTGWKVTNQEVKVGCYAWQILHCTPCSSIIGLRKHSY